ncbi:MAG: DUF4386 family protein [Thermoplasmata archaeon]
MREEKSVLRVGGLAGVLTGVILILGFITFFLAFPPPDPEQALGTFPEDRTLLTVSVDLFIVSLLLSLPFLAALYRSLREPNRVFARIGLGTGVLAAVMGIVALTGFMLATNTFSVLYADATTSDRPVVVATYAAVFSLLDAGNTAAFIFFGLAFVAFGLAMKRSQDFPEGLAWLSVVLGIIIILFIFLNLFPVAIIAIVVFALVLGWKVYNLSRAPGAG